jgi:circadian clock protein KaiB
MTPRSIQAIDNLKKICEEQLRGRYTLEVIDISQQPEAVRKEEILATPTLIKELPKPIRRIIGDLSNRERILIGLNLKPKENEQQ